MKEVVFSMRLALLFLALAPSAFTAGSGVTVDDVAKMLEAQIPEQAIVAKIRSSQPTPNLSADEMIRLKKAGATANILTAMVGAPASNPGAPGGVELTRIGAFVIREGTPDPCQWKWRKSKAQG